MMPENEMLTLIRYKYVLRKNAVPRLGFPTGSLSVFPYCSRVKLILALCQVHCYLNEELRMSLTSRCYQYTRSIANLLFNF